MKSKLERHVSRILVADDDNALRHAISKLLTNAGHCVVTFDNGADALDAIQQQPFELAILDIWMPRMSGLEVLAQLPRSDKRPKVIIMTSDNTPETLLRAVREQAYDYMAKPFRPVEMLECAQRALVQDDPPIEVICAQPHWVELLAPCTRTAADRIEGFILHLETGLPEDVRIEIAAAFRELLMNAVEWGGQLDPTRKVRIAYVRTPRMIMYRISDPGRGFSFENLEHAAVGHPSSEPLAHMEVRQNKGIRPGGFGILMTKAAADELIYNEAQNEVIFIRYLAGKSAGSAKA